MPTLIYCANCEHSATYRCDDDPTRTVYACTDCVADLGDLPPSEHDEERQDEERQ